MDFTETRISTRRALEIFHWGTGGGPEYIYSLRLNFKKSCVKYNSNITVT